MCLLCAARLPEAGVERSERYLDLRGQDCRGFSVNVNVYSCSQFIKESVNYSAFVLPKPLWSSDVNDLENESVEKYHIFMRIL
jgi:hypothetical protein